MNLNQAIKAVAPHASKDRTLPIIGGVQIQNGRAIATDRYTLAIVTVTDLPLDVSVWLSPDDVKAGVERVTNETITFTSGATKPASTPPGDYPAVERIVDGFKPNSDGGMPVEGICFAVKHLVKFDSKHLAKNGSDNHPCFTFGVNAESAVKVSFAAYPEYTGMIVPIKHKEGR